MRRTTCRLLIALGALLALTSAHAAPPARQTVCTITVNSPDEQETLRRHLPASRYDFVELVERGRPDWLAASCRKAVTCDVLVVSAHFDGDDAFFPDQIELSEHLTMHELERASCSGSCPTLFSQLKEVYLFGCNTLNPAPVSSASAEIVRSLVREGRSMKQAEQQLRSLTAAHGESSRQRMRQVFAGVPVIYGFASSAPLGPVAGATLERYLRAGGVREIGRGRTSRSLLSHFAPFSMASAAGMTPADPHIGTRHDMCQFADDRLSPATKLSFVHELMQRPPAEARLYVDRIQRLTQTLDDATRRRAAVDQALEAIERDGAARERYLEATRETEPPAARVRLIDVARDLRWLSEPERRDELALMLAEVHARRDVDVPEVNLACDLNASGDLSEAFARRDAPAGADGVAHAAISACLGSAEGRARTLAALVSERDADVRVAQAYLRHRPIGETVELRRMAGQIALMDAGPAQVRALETLGRHYIADTEVVALLTRLYAQTRSWSVQSAIAGILMRAERASIADPQLPQLLREHRQPAPTATMVDALIERLQSL